MARVMTVLVANVTVYTEVVVVAGDASNELPVWENLDAAVAGTREFLFVRGRGLVFSKSSWNLLVILSLSLWGDALGGAVLNTAVGHETLDHPVACSRAVDACIDTSRAKIVVTTITHAAMKVLIFHGVVAVIAIHNPGCDAVRLGPECEVSITLGSCEIAKEI